MCLLLLFLVLDWIQIDAKIAVTKNSITVDGTQPHVESKVGLDLLLLASFSQSVDVGFLVEPMTSVCLAEMWSTECILS